jgi:hypothetical protein
VIDELLNLELYRREFQFNQPVFPPDLEEEGDDIGGEEINGLGPAGESFIVLNNGGGGQIEIREGGNLLMDQFGST